MTCRGLLCLVLALLGVSLIAPSASATALTACGTISAAGNYTLSGNLTASGQDCITVTVSNVAIDLKGHRIKGDGTHSGITDGGNTAANLVILNGTITNFAAGINLLSSHSFNATIDKVNVNGNMGVGIFLGSDDNTVTNVKALNNGSDGIHIAECCNTIASVQATGNKGEGIFAAGGYTLVSNSTVSKNGATGMDLEGGCSTVDNSKATGNKGDGIFANNCCNIVRETTASGNSGDGMDLEDCCNLVDKSTSTKNGGDGLFATSCCNIASNTTLTGNKDNGLAFTGADAVLIGDTANKNGKAGASLVCPSNAVRVNANGNSPNLLEDSSHGACTNANNKAPAS